MEDENKETEKEAEPAQADESEETPSQEVSR